MNKIESSSVTNIRNMNLRNRDLIFDIYNYHFYKKYLMISIEKHQKGLRPDVGMTFLYQDTTIVYMSGNAIKKIQC